MLDQPAVLKIYHKTPFTHFTFISKLSYFNLLIETCLVIISRKLISKSIRKKVENPPWVLQTSTVPRIKE